MSLSWELYLKIRKINLKRLIESKGIKTYEDLISTLNREDVVFPTQEEVSSYFPSKPLKNLKKENKKDERKSKSQEESFSYEDLGAYDVPVEKNAEEKLDIPERKPRRRKKKTTKKSSSRKWTDLKRPWFIAV